MRLTPRAALAVTAGVLALSAVHLPTASAAPGVVVLENGIDFKQYQNPEAGTCYPGLGTDLGVANRTGGTIQLFAEADCQGQIADTIPPGQVRLGENVGSFLALD